MTTPPPSEPGAPSQPVGALFQLHTIDDIPGRVLEERGALLREFFPADGEYAVTPGLSQSLFEIPAAGWRLIQHRDTDNLKRDTIAAPSRTSPGRWIVLYSSRGNDGRWIISTGGEGWTFPAVPARSDRRQHLQLELEKTAAKAGTQPRIHPTLTNTGETTWRNVADDSPTVLVWVLDDNGNPIFEPGFMYCGSSGTLPDLDPGETTRLYAAQIETPNVDALPVGIYRVTGMLQSLGLSTENPGTLLIS